MAKGQEASSFDDFVRARGDALWRTAWLLTGDGHAAEDLVQSALVKSWRTWDRISTGGEGAFEAYVRRVLFTTFLSSLRRRWTGERPTLELPPAPAPTQDLEQAHDLRIAIERLPDRQRAVIVLRYFEDLTEVQTARALNCATGTVKSQTAKALAALRASGVLSHEEIR